MPPGILLAAEATFDPANFWFALVTAAGVYALSGFPWWDRMLAAWGTGRRMTVRTALAGILGIFVPLGVILSGLGALAANPVLPTDGPQAVVSIFALGACFVLRAVATPMPTSEPAEAAIAGSAQTTAQTTTTTIPQQPLSPPRKPHGNKARGAALAALVLGALAWSRRGR